LSIAVIHQISTTCWYSGTSTPAFGFMARKVSAWACTRDFNFQSVHSFAILSLVMVSPLAKSARVNRKTISVVDLRADARARRRWLRQPPIKRLEGLELLRQSAHAYDPVTARLPRLLKVVKRKRD
jgi:hypothetical protein